MGASISPSGETWVPWKLSESYGATIFHLGCPAPRHEPVGTSCEAPHLAVLGFTQIWHLPPNKAMEQTGRGYDAYDLILANSTRKAPLPQVRVGPSLLLSLKSLKGWTGMSSRKPRVYFAFDNHDTQFGQSLGSWVDTDFKAQVRCVFYGDLYPNDECFDEGTSRTLKKLLLARRSARKLFAYGPMVDYFEHRNCIGFVRMGDSDHAGICWPRSIDHPAIVFAEQ
ncbi:hypothetical protein C8R48DRAFT_671531 [Suillus tomentosus]|nr:hypothetical protein C8R48DRAFT_671531 [Suillus tomentosus]